MGLSFSKLFSLFWSKKEIRILILGLVRTHTRDNRFGSRKLTVGRLVGQCRQDYFTIQIEGMGTIHAFRAA